MPKNKINDYTFYKIVNVNADVNLCYAGSTVNMKERVRCHKYNCNNPKSTKYNLKVYKTIREHGGWDEFKMIPIGTAEQLTLTEAHVIEEKYRIELCAELNGQRCHITKEELKERDKVNHHNYQQNNKEAICERKKVHYQNNKDVLCERSRVYQQNNKEAIKVRLSAKITCECSCEIRRGDILRHRKSKKHIDLMNNKNNIDVIHNE